MRTEVRIPIVVGCLLLATAGCSKSVAPLADSAPRGDRAASAGARANFTGEHSRAFRVQLHFVGPLVTLDRTGAARLDPRADFFVYGPQAAGAALDTVPAASVLRSVRWRRVSSSRGAAVPADSEYFDDVPQFAGSARPDSGQFTPGLHLLTLRVPPRAGGGTLQVSFVVDFAPSTWYAGPDPALFPRSSDGDGRAVDVVDWAHFTTSPAWPPDGRGYFGPDSFAFRPLQRRPVGGNPDRRTFYEIYGDRIYARSEGDTVHQHAWIVLVHGGFDPDSRYVPRVSPAYPGLPPGYAGLPQRYASLIAGGWLGSPIGFRSQLTTRTPEGLPYTSSETTSYPLFDEFSVYLAPHVAGYWRAEIAGKAYVTSTAEDAEGVLGRVHGSPAYEIADRVDAGGGSPQDRVDRRQILTFFVRPAATGGGGLAQGGGVADGRMSGHNR